MFCTDNDKNNGRNLTAVEVFNGDRGMVDKKLVDSIIDWLPGSIFFDLVWIIMSHAFVNNNSLLSLWQPEV